MKLFTTAILATVLAQQDYDDDFESNYNPEEDGEHKKGDIQYIHIDQGWVDFAARTDTIFRSLFNGVVNDADFIANVRLIAYFSLHVYTTIYLRLPSKNGRTRSCVKRVKTRSAVVFVVAESTRRPASALSNHRYGVLNV